MNMKMIVLPILLMSLMVVLLANMAANEVQKYMDVKEAEKVTATKECNSLYTEASDVYYCVKTKLD